MGKSKKKKIKVKQRKKRLRKAAQSAKVAEVKPVAAQPKKVSMNVGGGLSQ
tara:strand:- start:6779 stop:6931 length:153 start_codon:yes stop_codon:yes gene_type:complete